MENAVRKEIIHYRLCFVLKVNVTKNTLAALISQLENVTMCPGLPVDRRAVGRSENLGVPVLFGGHNLPHLVEIGLTDLPKSPPAPPGTTGLI